jgi:IPT/TIG domain
VTISGFSFTGATDVRFGPTSASFKVQSDTSISAVTPPGKGDVRVIVTTPGGASRLRGNDSFLYTGPPAVTKVKPRKGPRSGGTAIVISGANFTGATAVKFGSVAAASFKVNSEKSVTAVSPPEPKGVVHVTVTTPVGTSAVSGKDQFKFH